MSRPEVIEQIFNHKMSQEIRTQAILLLLRIPTRKNLVYVPFESYLKFTHNVTASAVATNYIRFDSCGAHGSNVFFNIDNYGLLSKNIFDLQVPTDSSYGKYNILAGTRSDLTVSVPTTVAADFTTATPLVNSFLLPALQTSSGLRMNSAQTAVAGILSQIFCLNLITLAGEL